VHLVVGLAVAIEASWVMVVLSGTRGAIL